MSTVRVRPVWHKSPIGHTAIQREGKKREEKQKRVRFLKREKFLNVRHSSVEKYAASSVRFAGHAGSHQLMSVDRNVDIPLVYEPCATSSTGRVRRASRWLSQYRRFANRRPGQTQEKFRHCPQRWSPKWTEKTAEVKARESIVLKVKQRVRVFVPRVKEESKPLREKKRVRNFVPWKTLKKGICRLKHKRMKKLEVVNLDELLNVQLTEQQSMEQILDSQSYFFALDVPDVIPQSDRVSVSLGRPRPPERSYGERELLANAGVRSVGIGEILFENSLASAMSDVSEPPVVFAPPPPRRQLAVNEDVVTSSAMTPVVQPSKKKKPTRVYAQF